MLMLHHRCGPRLLVVPAYVALLKRLGARSVYDPHPWTGSKAMACALLQIPYYTQPDALFDAALERGFAGFIGLDHRYLGGSERPHFSLVDRNFHSDVIDRAEFDRALDFSGASERLAVAVPAASKGSAIDWCMPDNVVDCLVAKKVFHFFVW